MLKVTRQISPLFELALELAHETGHGIGSVRLLRWSDIDLDKKTARRRGENDKIGLEHVIAPTAKALKTLKRAWKERPMIGEAWLFPAPGTYSNLCHDI